MGLFLFTIAISGLASLVLVVTIVGRVSQQCRRAVDHAGLVQQAEQIRDARRLQPAGIASTSGFPGYSIAVSRESAR